MLGRWLIACLLVAAMLPVPTGPGGNTTFAAAPIGSIDITAGDTYSCTVRADGGVSCWGRNDAQQAAAPAGVFTDVESGAFHSCGLATDRSIACWGFDKSGQATPPAGEFTAVTAGGYHSCAIDVAGAVACWGSDDFGQATPPAGAFTTIDAGYWHTCGIRTDTTVECWGGNDQGQAAAPPGDFTELGAGLSHTCAIRTDTTVDCWGSDLEGQTTPPPGEFTSVTSGWAHSCAVATDHTITCWGYNRQLEATPPTGAFLAVDAGFDHTCGVRDDTTITCWGNNVWGQLTPPQAGVTDVSAFAQRVCVVRVDETGACWGHDFSGGLAYDPPSGPLSAINGYSGYICGLRPSGAVECRGNPTLRQGPFSVTEPPGTFTAINGSGCGLRPSRTIECWIPQGTELPAGEFTAIADACALRVDGASVCWNNIAPLAGVFVDIGNEDWTAGQRCGIRADGTVACYDDWRGQPIDPPAGEFFAVTGGCGIRRDRTLACWAQTFVAIQGVTVPREPTVPAGEFTDVAVNSIESFTGQRCAVRVDRVLQCWGGRYAMLGDPVLVRDFDGNLDVVGPPPAIRTVTPARLVDTRTGPGETTIDGLYQGIGRRPAGSTTEITITGRAGIPTTADAILINLTATNPEAPGYLTAYPCDTTPPLASTLNYTPGQTIANTTLTKLAPNGRICIYTHADTDIIIDLNGYVPGGSSPDTVTPARLVDTRTGPTETTIDGQFQGIGRGPAGSITEITITGRAGIPTTADAVLINLTATNPEAPGYLTAYPCDTTPPLASTLNYTPGQTIANTTLTKLAPNGRICIYTHADTDIIIDLNGYVPGGSSPDTVTPARLVDTRTGPTETTIDGQFQGIGRGPAGSITEITITGRAGIPTTADAVLINLTATNPEAPGYLTAYPCNTTPPHASTLNYTPGQTTANTTLTKLAPNGRICIYTHADTDIIIDLNGYVPGPL